MADCDIVKVMEEMVMSQETTYEVRMQKDGQYQVIVRRPNSIEQHVAHFKTEAEAEAWVATLRHPKM